MDIPLPVNTDQVQNSLFQTKIDELSRVSQTDNKKNLSVQEKNDMAKAARGFESIFINMMRKEMKSAMLDEDSEKGEGETTFGANVLEGYTDMQFADQMAKTGKGIGIAEMLYTQMTGGGKLPAITVHSSEINYQNPINEFFNSKQLLNQDSKPKDLQSINLPKTGNFLDRVQSRISDYGDFISQASSKFNVPESLIKAVISTESAGKSDAKSKAGAKGLMQLMDSTAQDLGVTNSFNPSQNIMGGAQYLRQMLDKYDGDIDKALAAYNAGPGNVDKFGGIPPFKETQSYVQRVKQFNDLFNSDSNVNGNSNLDNDSIIEDNSGI